MRLITFDLDDTLMANGHDYAEAKDEFGEFVAERADITPEEATETLDEFDRENVSTQGLSMDRFPQSMVEAFTHIVDDPIEPDIEAVREIGYSVFKTTETYAERGFFSGAEELLQSLQGEEASLHLITAGDERVQNRKINALNLDSYFDDTHVVPVDSKHDRITHLMATHGIPPEETIHVGNSMTSDVEPTLEAGAHAFYVPLNNWRGDSKAEEYRDHDRVTIFDTLTDITTESPDVFETREVSGVAQ